ncbi:hypothetical protein CDAR_507961 [Caerostris darwini]|uniref:Uncharacterized protein n=1 Tax=Caerostris darwini TaxID=1538125 RepID=A0AAV4MVR1_9ARAC|nr:hypothetical protein CDAR_507961 [Caerostris darwini]
MFQQKWSAMFRNRRKSMNTSEYGFTQDGSPPHRHAVYLTLLTIRSVHANPVWVWRGPDVLHRLAERSMKIPERQEHFFWVHGFALRASRYLLSVIRSFEIMWRFFSGITLGSVVV